MIEIPEPYKKMPFSIRPLPIFVLFHIEILAGVIESMIAGLTGDWTYFLFSLIFFACALHQIRNMSVTIKMIRLTKEINEEKKLVKLYKRLYMTDAR